MTHKPLAFAAGYWGDQAVVCRAEEDSAGPVVAQEFGVFSDWTGSNAFAVELNKGLGLTHHEAQEIIFSSHLAASGVVRPVAPPDRIWSRAPVLMAANQVQLQYLFASLQLGITCLLLARERKLDRSYRQMRKLSAKTVDRVVEAAPRLRLKAEELERLLQLTQRLQELLREFSGDLSSEDLAQ